MMIKPFKLMFFAVILLFGSSCFKAVAQTRRAVSGAEVTGTFRSYFSGKAKGSYDEIKILALGKGKLKVSFDLLYPFTMANGEIMPNLGTAQGEATISGDTAIYTGGADLPNCKITIKFVKPGTLKVTQSGTDAECGFGVNVTADGTYKKASATKPKFDQ